MARRGDVNDPVEEMTTGTDNMTSSMDSMLKASSILADEMLKQARNKFSEMLGLTQKALDEERKQYNEKITELRQEMEEADEEDKQRIEEKIKLEEERYKVLKQTYQQEVASYEAEYKHSKQMIELERQRAESREKLEENTKRIQDIKRQAKEDAETARGVKGAEASKFVGAAGGIGKMMKGDLGASGGIKSPYLDKMVEATGEQSKLLKQQIRQAEEEGDTARASELKKELAENEKERKSAEFEKSLLDGVNNLNTTFVQEVNKAVNVLEANELKANTRLMGSTKQFSDKIGSIMPFGAASNAILDKINKLLAASPFVKSTDVINNISAGISKGIVTNVETRGFLESIKDGIVATFDAFDEKINRLIRIQQQDSTAARMGMEASLMKLYNSMFETSEYLNSGFDNVTNAIYEASAIVTAGQAEEREFVLQKWLGALYSVGMSEGTISNLANAIGQVMAGDVSGVGQGAQNLIAMALTKTGMTYDQLFTSGATASELNTLMYAIVSYLQEISEASQGNNVVQKELGNAFGVQISDIKAATNLTAQDMKALLGFAQSYKDAQNELQSQVGSMYQRMSISSMMSNIYENFMFTAGMAVAENPITFLMEKILAVMPDMEIPMPQAMGFGLSSGIPLKDIIQTALSGFGIISAGLSAISSLGAAGGLNLNAWKMQEDVRRGSPMITFSSGFSQQTSASGYTAAGGAEDIRQSAMGSGAEQAEEGGKTVGTGGADVEYTTSNVYKLLTGEEGKDIVPIRVVEQTLSNDVTGWAKKTNEVVEVLSKIKDDVQSIKANSTSNNIASTLTSLFGGKSKGTSEEVKLKDIDEELLTKLSLPGGFIEAVAEVIVDKLTTSPQPVPVETSQEDLIISGGGASRRAAGGQPVPW